MSDSNFHIIDEYLLGRLEGKALADFTQKMSKDAALAQKVTERRALVEQVDWYGDYELKERLKEMHQEEMEWIRQRQLKQRGLIIGLILLALLAFFLVRWSAKANPERSADPEKLYAQYFNAYPLQLTTRAGVDQRQLAAASQLYSTGDYQKALPIFQAILAEDQEQSEIRLAIGICQMELGQFPEAIQHFENMRQSDFDPFEEQASWYLALSYLRNGSLQEAKGLLNEITTKPESVFAREAEGLKKAF